MSAWVYFAIDAGGKKVDVDELNLSNQELSALKATGFDLEEVTLNMPITEVSYRLSRVLETVKEFNNFLSVFAGGEELAELKKRVAWFISRVGLFHQKTIDYSRCAIRVNM